MNNDQQKIELEKQLKKMALQLIELNRRVSLLERENNRRKLEIGQVARIKG